MYHANSERTGVLTTTSIAYLTALQFRSNVAQISEYLQDSKETLDSIGKPRKMDRRVIEYQSRNSVSETMKDLWNSEVTRSVSWLYSTLGYEKK